MNHFITLVLTTIVAINNISISQATLYTYANNVKEAKSAGTATHYFKLNAAAMENKENIQQPHENKLKFQHTIQQKNGLNQDTLIKYPTYNENTPNLYNPSKLYTSVDYNVEHNNDVVDDAYKKQTLYQHQPIKDNDYDLTQQEKPSLLKQLQSQHQELSEGYATFLQDPYQVVAPPKQEIGSSNDHQQSQYLTAYVTPPPQIPPSLANTKMHLNLQHHQQNYNNNKPKIVSYATGNEASPTSTSTTSIKSLQQQQHHNMLQYGVKYVTNNELNTYDFNRQPALVYGQPGGGLQPGSKQYLYAPMHSALDRKLPYSIKTFPYPPSFISLTTTEKPFNNYQNFNHRSAYKKIPDLFSHRQSKSLLDSYIPSWQVTKLLQQYQGKQSVQGNNNNLHTLAFVMPYKNYYKRDVNKV